MSIPKLHYFFDYSSPYCYLGTQRIESVAQSAGAELVWKPILLGGIFKSLGGPMVPLTASPQVKQDYNMTDMRRWAEHFSIPFSWPSQFPMNTVKALRITMQLDDPAPFIHRVYRAYWAENQDISDPSVLTEILNELGLAHALLANTADPEIKRLLIDATQEALDRGVFGAPTCLVGDELYFGQDRFQFVASAIKRHAS
jgi:2-hydroxychromene-2-carboxylate isomerase